MNNSPLQRREIITRVQLILNLSDEDKVEKTKAGRNKISDRVDWACVYLRKANMIYRTKKGLYSITSLGEKVVLQETDIDNKIIAKYCKEFAQYQYIAENYNNTLKS